MKNRAQVSVEMIIVVAIVVGLALFLFTTLQKNAEDYSKTINNESENLRKKLDQFVK